MLSTRTSSCPTLSSMSPATAALADSHPVSPRIPPALQALYLQANSDQQLTVCPELVAKSLTPHYKGNVPHHKKRPTNKYKQQQPPLLLPGLQQTPKRSIPRVVTLTAADAATASIKTRQLQVALEGCSMNESFPSTTNNIASANTRVITSSTPQEYLNAILSERGYSTATYPTLQSACVHKPTALQQASYHMYMINLVRSNDLETFRNVMLSGLVAPNPCNQFAESLLHMVCRRGRIDMLKVMLQAGAGVHVCDDFGRTPLHDACWASETAFDVVRVLLDLDVRLVSMSDLRGSLPLVYVPKKDHGKWIHFLDSVKDVYWPHRGAAPAPQSAPPVTLEAPHSRRVVPPRVPEVTCEMASLVASGQMSPDQGLMVVTGSSSCSFRESSSSEGSSKRESASERQVGDDDDDSMGSEDDEDFSDSWSDEDEDSLSSSEMQEIYANVHQRRVG